MSTRESSDCQVSVVICAYNAETRLPEVLEALRTQVVPPHVHWEVVVVDNNSSDGTAAVARDRARAFREGTPLHVVCEPEQGLIHARRRGWLHSMGAIVCYLDDDNVVTPTWIMAVWEFFRRHPKAGMVGPKIVPLLDAPPPAYFEYVKGALAIRDCGDSCLDTTFSNEGHPPGAGMSFPRHVLDPVFGTGTFAVLGRTGEDLSSGEDSMIALAIRNAGWEWWYEPRMVLHHRIPRSRLEVPYLLRLFRGLGRSSAHTAEAARGTTLAAGEHASYVWRYALRLAAYSVLSRVSLRPAYRVYARALCSMFVGGIQVHVRAMMAASRRGRHRRGTPGRGAPRVT